MENKIINGDNDINKELYKTNESFSDELKRCSLILDIYFAKDIKDKVLLDKKEFEFLSNKYDENKKMKNK